MAFALTAAEFRGVQIQTTTKKRGIQQAVLTITGAASDVDLDIGDDSGTFWTAALADATYGARATKVQEILQRLDDNVVGLVAVKSPQLIDRVQAATASSNGQFSLAVQNHRPNLGFNANDGETSYTIIMEWELNDGIFPVVASYG